MSDLQKVINGVSKAIYKEASTITVYKYSVEYSALLTDIHNQLTEYFGTHDLDISRDLLASSVNSYCTYQYQEFRRRLGPSDSIIGHALSFIVIFQTENPNKTLDFVNYIRKKALERLQASITMVITTLAQNSQRQQTRVDMSSKFSGNSDLDRGIIEFGHTQGVPLSQEKIIIPEIKANSRLRRLPVDNRKTTNNPIAKISFDMWTNYGDLKEGSIRLIFDKEVGKTDRDKFRNAALKELKKVNWFTSKTPVSAVDIAEGQVLSSLYKIGAKGGNKAKATNANKKYKDSAEKTVNRKVITGDIKDSLQNTLKVGATIINSDEESRNWSSIIPIINQKLHSQLAKNMVKPSLQYRTGTFARSVKVLGVHQTSRGYPSFIYDYQRSPYDVFDKYKGASPWNTPERDPRTLIDRSIREIMKELAIGRFYLRRAS